VVALVTLVVVMVLVLGVLVVGLLRSHADILHALHSLGAGVGGDEVTGSGGGGARTHSHDHVSAPAPADVAGAPTGNGSRTGPLVIGPTLPPERDTSSVPDVTGVTPAGDAVSLVVGGAAHHTLLAFLSSGCTTCQTFWEALARPQGVGLPPEVRPVVVTRGIEFESPSDLAKRDTGVSGVPVVMSTAAWDAYEVPGSPFFVLVDGPGARRIGEGSGMRMEQIVRMVAQALEERGANPARLKVPSAEAADRQRERENDRLLLSAGIHPGHSSLFPASMDDVVPGGTGARPDGNRQDPAPTTGDPGPAAGHPDPRAEHPGPPDQAAIGGGNGPRRRVEG
jgi:hypothetical protein